MQTVTNDCTLGRPLTGVPSVRLDYDKYIPPNGNETERPLVILHGFLYVVYHLSTTFWLPGVHAVGLSATGNHSQKHLCAIYNGPFMLWYVQTSSICSLAS